MTRTKKSSKIIVILAVCAAVIVAALASVYVIRNNQQAASAKGRVVADNTSEWDGSLQDNSEGQQGIKIPGYGDITMQADTNTWQMSLVNPEGNTCYFKYSLEIADTDEILYESDLIEPGKAITEFQVQKTLEQGDYTLYINVNTYTMDDSLSPLNGAQVKTTLHIV